MVVTARPSHSSAGVRHESSASQSSLLTVQTPQVPVAQPSLVPVKPTCSLITSSSVWRGDTSSS